MVYYVCCSSIEEFNGISFKIGIAKNAFMFTALTSGVEMLSGTRPKQENYILFSTCKGVVSSVDALMKKSKRKNVFISAVARQPVTSGRWGRPFVGAPQYILY